MSTTTDPPTDATSSDDPSPQPTDPIPTRSTRTVVLGLLGAGIAGVGLWLTAGDPALAAVAVIAVGLAWYRLDEWYAIALGHAMVLPIVPAETASPELLVVELGLFVLLVAPAADADTPVSFVGMALLALGGLVAVAAGSYEWTDRLWIAAGVLLGAIVLGGYTLYRHELVRLDLVERTDGDST